MQAELGYIAPREVREPPKMFSSPRAPRTLLTRPIGSQVSHTFHRLLLGWGGIQAAGGAQTRSVDKGTIKTFSKGPLYRRMNLGSQARAKGTIRGAQSHLLLLVGAHVTTHLDTSAHTYTKIPALLKSMV